MSVATGTVMRISEDDNPRWMDNMALSQPPRSYISAVSELTRLIQFLSHINPTRAGLLCTHMTQLVCTPDCTYDPIRVVVPLYHDPLLMAPTNYEARETKLLSCVLGLNLLTVFCNMDLTFEDDIMILVSAASKFKYFCSRVVVLPNGFRIPQIGDEIDPFSVPC